MRLIAVQEEWITIEIPAQGRMCNTEVSEDLVIKLMLSNDQLMHLGQEGAGFGPLNESVVIGAADVNCLADTELRERFGRHRLILGWVFNRTGRNNY